MIPSRGLLKASPASTLRPSIPSNPKIPRRASTVASRHYSQARTIARLITSPNKGNGLGFASASSTGSGSSTVFSQRVGASRNLSLWSFGSEKAEESPITEAATPPISEPLPTAPEPQSHSTVESTPISSSSPTSTPTDFDLGSSLDDFALEPSVLDIPEQIGYLKSLGLEYGPGPTAMSEWLLEHLYIYTGMPWWATIAVSALLFRALLFKPVLTGSRHQALMAQVHASPEYAQAKADFDHATWRTKDQVAMMTARARMSSLVKRSGARWWRPFAALLTVPFSIGMFRLLRGMAGIPVPSLEEGGLAWFSDLTVHDPYFILPIINLGMSVLMLKYTSAANLNQTEQQKAIQKGMLYIMPPMLFIGTGWLPAGVQWFFISLTAGSAVQGWATLQPAVRQWAGLPPLPTNTLPAPSKATIQYKGPVSRNSDSKEEKGGFKKNLDTALGWNSKEKDRLEKARRHEERRAAEEKEKAWRRLEDLRRKRAAKGERY